MSLRTTRSWRISSERNSSNGHTPPMIRHAMQYQENLPVVRPSAGTGTLPQRLISQLVANHSFAF
jgi:hypothetical protein